MMSLTSYQSKNVTNYEPLCNNMFRLNSTMGQFGIALIPTWFGIDDTFIRLIINFYKETMDQIVPQCTHLEMAYKYSVNIKRLKNINEINNVNKRESMNEVVLFVYFYNII
jgi:hypothetical protein